MRIHLIIFILFSTFPATAQLPQLWNSGRIYVYSAEYIDSSGKTITSEIVKIRPTGKTWKADPKQTLAIFELDFSTGDSARLAPIPLNNIQRAWQRNYKEGVMQNDQKIWMHPIRNNQYLLTEIAPFPEVLLPLNIDTSWQSTLWIYKAFGSFEGTVESTYKIAGKEQRSYDFGEINCWKITAVGKHNKLGESTVDYYFNEYYGFTEMNYTFFNSQKIVFKLIELQK